MELALTAAARKDEAFGQAVTELVARLREAEQASGRSVVAGAGSAVFTGDAHAHAEGGGIAFGQVAGDVNLDRGRVDPPRAGAAGPLTAPGTPRGASAGAVPVWPRPDVDGLAGTSPRQDAAHRPGEVAVLFHVQGQAGGMAVGVAEQVTHLPGLAAGGGPVGVPAAGAAHRAA